MNPRKRNSGKKLTLAIWILGLGFSAASGQIPLPQRGEDYNIGNFHTRVVEFKPSNYTVSFRNVHAIKIWDARADTLAFGLSQQNHQKPFFLVFDQGFAPQVQQFVDLHTVFGNSDSLGVEMVIKKFWISGGLDNDVNDQVRKTGLADTSAEKIANLQVRIEFFLKKDSDYYILYRFDSTLLNNIRVSRDASELVMAGLEASLLKLSEMDSDLPSIPQKKKRFSWQEIETYNAKRFDIPILKDSVYVSGVYMSFQEFKENNPSQKEYEVKKDKLTDLIFIKGPDGNMTTTRDTWGYSDGKNLYIRSRENYFRLQRRGNGFYTYASRQYKHKKVAYIPGLGIVSNAVAGGPTTSTSPVDNTSEHLALKLKPFELDWETGELK